MSQPDGAPGTVMTVRGPVPAERLGITLPHEHLLHDGDTGRQWNSILTDPDLAIAELEPFKAAGGSTVVELSCVGTGPLDPRLLQHISEASGVHIVACSGFYEDDFLPPFVQTTSVDGLAEMLVRDVRDGIRGTEVRAGVIGEIASGKDGVSPTEERVFRAAARAQRQTGLAISTHCHLGRHALWQLDILEQEGVALDRVAVGHLDTNLHMDHARDLEYHTAIAARGAYVEYDCVGKNYLFPDLWRAEMVARLVDGGFLERVLLSHDVNLRSHLHAYGGFGYDYLLTSFAPLLRGQGLTEEQVQTILVDNPRRLLASDPTHGT